MLDAWPGRGPLVGIYTGLLNSRSEKNLAVACDMPFLNPRLIRDMLDEGIYSVRELLKRIKVRYLEAEEIDRFDPQHLSFFNINTEDDLKHARDIIHKDELAAARARPASNLATQI